MERLFYPVQFSIVAGTLNRITALKNMINNVRAMMFPYSFEFTIVDGNSTDGSVEWLRDQRDVYLIEQKAALGAVAAFQAGFIVSRGRYIVNLNDDCMIIGDVFQRAVKQLDEDKSIGQITIPFTCPAIPKPHYDAVGLGHPKKQWRYANFGITRGWLGTKVGWWEGTGACHYGGDSHCSMKIWNAGYKVADLEGDGYIEHLELKDNTRRDNLESHLFYNYWRDWQGAPSKPTLFENQ